MQSQKPTVLLLGVTHNTDNYGVRVLLSGAIETLASMHPDADIALLDYGRQSERWNEFTTSGNREVELINLRFSWKLHLRNNAFRLLALVILSRCLPLNLRQRLYARNPWLARILHAQCLYSLAGGDSFSDIYGLRRLLYVALPQLLVLFMGKPLVLLPQTYGPFRSRAAKFIARFILLRASKVYSRDEEGVGAVRSVTNSDVPKVHVTPDLGFCMVPEPLDAALLREVEAFRGNDAVVGINISSLLYMGGYTGNNMFQLREPFPHLMEELVAHVTNNLGAKVLLIPHVCGGPLSQEDETRLCKRLESEWRARCRDRVRYLPASLTHRQMKSLIGACDMFMGARMHACIGAVSQGVPSVCLAYSKKFAGVMAILGGGARVVDLRQASVSDVLAATAEILGERTTLRPKLTLTAREIVQKLKRLFQKDPDPLPLSGRTASTPLVNNVQIVDQGVH